MSVRPTIKQLGFQTSIYGLGNIISKLAAFFLIPIYTKFLRMSDVGILALLEMVEFLLITILPFGLINALWRYLPKEDKSERQRFISTAFWGIQILGAIILSIIGLNWKWFAAQLSLGDSKSILFLITISNVFLFISGQFILWMQQYEGKPIQYIILSLGQFLGILFLTIYFVVFHDKGLFGVLISKTIIYGLLFLLSCGYVLINAFRFPRMQYLVKMLKYGMPFILIALVTPILTFSDRYFLKMFVTLDEIGVYSIAYKFGMLINMLLVVPLRRSWGPMMYKLGVRENSKSIYRDVLFYYSVIGSFLAILIIFFARDILRVATTEEYLTGALIIPWVVFAYFLNGFRVVFITGAALKDKTFRMGQAGVFAIFVNLLLNYLFIKYFGVMGAALATTLSYLFLTILIYHISQRVLFVNWKWKRMIKLGLVTVALLIIVLLLQAYYQEFHLGISILGVLIYVPLLLTTGIIGAREIRGIQSLFNQIIQFGKQDEE